MNALVGTFNQEKALVGAFSVIVQPVVEPMDLFYILPHEQCDLLRSWCPAAALVLLCPEAGPVSAQLTSARPK